MGRQEASRRGGRKLHGGEAGSLIVESDAAIWLQLEGSIITGGK